MGLSCPACKLEMSNWSPRCPKCDASQPAPSDTVPIAQRDIGTILSGKTNAYGALHPAKKYSLVVMKGAEPGGVFPLTKTRTTLGRSGCDIELPDPELSRQHAVLWIEGLAARVEDLDSTNGTFIGEERIQRADLSDKGEFRLGSHELLFVVSDRE